MATETAPAPFPAPTVGRVVHYVSHGSPVRADGTQAYAPQRRAAIVTEVVPDGPGWVGLAVLNPSGLFFHSLADGGCEYAPVQEGQRLVGGTWHWPERV